MTISVPIVGFFFVCIVLPHLVKHKAQFYIAFAVIIIILLLDIVADVTIGSSVGFAKFLYVARGVCWILDLVLLVLATGGLSLQELGGEFKNAYQVMRRGEDKPTLIIPQRDNPYAARSAPVEHDEPEHRVFTINDPSIPPPAPAVPPPPPEADRTIPLE